jgi:hypothetical protein
MVLDALPGRGTATALLCLASKLLAVSCTGNPAERQKLAAGIDMGFLVLIGALSGIAARPALSVMRQTLVEIVVVHLALEMVYSWWDAANGGKPMGKDMIIHHVAAVVSGLFCLFFHDGAFFSPGVKLVVTECTTALPVSLRLARTSGKYKGIHGMAIGLIMPLAFMWRTRYSMDAFRHTKSIMDDMGGVLGVRGWWMALGGVGGVVCCNAYWTVKIFQGLYKKLFGKKRKPKRAERENGTQSPPEENSQAK